MQLPFLSLRKVNELVYKATAYLICTNENKKSDLEIWNTI